MNIVLTAKLDGWLRVKGWSSRDLARALRCQESVVSSWRSGSRHPSWQQLIKLHRLTGLDIGDILTVNQR